MELNSVTKWIDFGLFKTKALPAALSSKPDKQIVYHQELVPISQISNS